jgi:hypothetical protein
LRIRTLQQFGFWAISYLDSCVVASVIVQHENSGRSSMAGSAASRVHGGGGDLDQRRSDEIELDKAACERRCTEDRLASREGLHGGGRCEDELEEEV